MIGESMVDGAAAFGAALGGGAEVVAASEAEAVLDAVESVTRGTRVKPPVKVGGETEEDCEGEDDREQKGDEVRGKGDEVADQLR